MYSKVNTDMNFVEREKEVEEFWKEDNTFKKSMEQREAARHIPFMTDRLPQMVSRTSVMC